MTNRILATLAAAATFAAVGSAQCFTLGAGTQVTAWTWTFANDDGVSANHIPLGFAFPIAGAAAASFDHVRVGSNGWLMLTDGTNATGLPGNSAYGSTANLAGLAGQFPIVAPFWGDLLWDAGANNGVFVETTPGVSAKFVWANVRDYDSAAAGAYSFAVELFANGSVHLSYDAAVDNKTTGGQTNVVGVSARNGVAVPAASDYVPGPASSAGGMIFQGFPLATFDGQDKTLAFTPNGAGWNQSVSCQLQSASHAAYGVGCYDITDSLYQLFADAALAAPALAGTSFTFTPSGSSYLVTSGGGSYVAPVAASNLFATASDDGEQLVTPSAPLLTPQGPQASLHVHANGVVSWGASGQTFPGTFSYQPTAPAFLTAANAGIWAWHDYNETEAGSGRIKVEEVAGVLYLTWDGVENYSASVMANPGTMQIQLELATGIVKVVFVTVDSDTTSIYGSAHLVGYSPGGASVDGGSVVLATALPQLLTTGSFAMTLSASPAPVSTPTSGTLVVYTQDNIPEAAPGIGIRLGATIVSLSANIPGLDLTALGMPGCRLYVGGLDLLNSFVGPGDSQTTTFQVPAGLPYGFQFHAQAVALIQPNSQPNGQNAFGATLSNGVASFVSSF